MSPGILFHGWHPPGYCYTATTLNYISLSHRLYEPRSQAFVQGGGMQRLAIYIVLYWSRLQSDVFLKRKADTQLDPFSMKRVKLYEPCNTTVFIWSLPAEILVLIIALLGARDMRCVAQVCSLLREIARPLFFSNRNFPTSPKDLFHIRVDSPSFDILSTWIWMDAFHPPRMMLCWLNPDLRALQLSAFLHFLQSVPHKSIQYITLFWNFDILALPILPQILTFLENIHASGCEELMCMGFYHFVGSSGVTRLTRMHGHMGVNHLKAFEASLWVLFSPEFFPFTIQTICSSNLEKLRLIYIKLSSAHWEKLMRCPAWFRNHAWTWLLGIPLKDKVW